MGAGSFIFKTNNMKVGQKVRVKLGPWFNVGDVVTCVYVEDSGSHIFSDGKRKFYLPRGNYELIDEQACSFKLGDIVLVRDNGDKLWNETIFLFEKDGRYHCTTTTSMRDVFDGYLSYYVCKWDQIKEKPAVKEMTVEEISRELGYEIKIVE